MSDDHAVRGLVRRADDGPLAVLTFASPPLNLFDQQLLDELRDALAAVAADQPRALLIQAEGRVVSAGVDVNLFAPLTAATGTAMWAELFEMMHGLEAMPFPTVFAAHRLCLTAAFELALACDLLLAAESASFGLVEAVVGLTPSMGGPQRLAERAGPARARELVYTGDIYSAAALERWNVVNRVLPDEGFADAAREFALKLAHGPTRAHAATKSIIRAQLDGGTYAADEMTSAASGALFETQDLKKAVQSFLDVGPGKATFEGR